MASNLSGSSCSGLSRLGRSFHPRSYERKGILNLMHDFLRKESTNKDMISRESSGNALFLDLPNVHILNLLSKVVQ